MVRALSSAVHSSIWIFFVSMRGAHSAKVMDALTEEGTRTDASVLSGNLFVGLCLSVLATVMNSTGMNLQRYAKTKEMPLLNIVGIILSTTCGLVDMCSFHFAPQSLLAPVGAFTLVFNLLLAPVLHSEKILLLDILSTLLVFVGTITCLYFGSRHKQTYDLDELYSLSMQKNFHVYIVFVVSTILTLVLYIRNSEKMGRGTLRSVGIAYPICAGILGGSTVLTVRTIGEICKTPSYSIYVVVALVVLVGCIAFSQIFVLNRGLGKHSSLLVIPVFTGTFISANIVGGGILYKEFANASLQERYAYSFGLLLVICGVLVLTLKERKEKIVQKQVEME